jgi:hypothetical protein
MMIPTTSSITAALDVILINVTRCFNDITTTSTTTTITSSIGLINVVRRDEREDVADRAADAVLIDDDRIVAALGIRWVDKVHEVSADGSEFRQGGSSDESCGVVLP